MTDFDSLGNSTLNGLLLLDRLEVFACSFSPFQILFMQEIVGREKKGKLTYPCGALSHFDSGAAFVAYLFHFFLFTIFTLILYKTLCCFSWHAHLHIECTP